MKLEIVATVVAVYKTGGTRDGGQWAVGRIRHEGKEVAGIGSFHEMLAEGVEYRFFGEWGEYKGQRQFRWNSYVVMEEQSPNGIVSYLASFGAGYGIGQKRSMDIYRMFGEDSLRMVREEPEKVAAAIPGLKVQNVQIMAGRMQAVQGTERLRSELMGILYRKGFPRSLPDKLIEVFGNRAVEEVRQNPFVLMGFSGCGFLRCDGLYLDLGLPKDDPIRQAYCIHHVICQQMLKGHTWCRALDLLEDFLRLCPGGCLKIALEDSRERELICTMRLNSCGEISSSDGDLYVADYDTAESEWTIADVVVRQLSHHGDVVRWPVPESIADITPHQREVLHHVFGGRIGILSGSPGTGKTYLTARVCRRCIELFGEDEVVCAAPTGKAAVRLTESLRAAGVGLTAKTCHSILKPITTDGAKWEFEHDHENPLLWKVIVVDESSMVDTNLMASLMDALPESSLLLLVGDVNQLPPVGPGAPLRDLIASGVPCGELEEILRNSGGITESCRMIRLDEPWSGGDNLFLRTSATLPERQLNEIMNILKDEYDRGLDPVWDCQIMVPVNKKSQVSRVMLNQVLQGKLNQSKGDGGPLLLNDKVVNLKNERYNTLDREKVWVANGELGRVVDMNEKCWFILLEIPRENEDLSTVVIERPRKKKKASEDDDAKEEDNNTLTGTNWDLAYAMTVHKCQGSDWPVAITVLDEYAGASFVYCRAWIYTAISRAKDRAYIIGSKFKADGMCRINRMQERKTMLVEGINQLRTRSHIDHVM